MLVVGQPLGYYSQMHIILRLRLSRISLTMRYSISSSLGHRSRYNNEPHGNHDKIVLAHLSYGFNHTVDLNAKIAGYYKKGSVEGQLAFQILVAIPDGNFSYAGGISNFSLRSVFSCF